MRTRLAMGQVNGSDIDDNPVVYFFACVRCGKTIIEIGPH